VNEPHIPYIYTGWWYTNPSEKYESQLGVISRYMEKTKNVANQQALYIDIYIYISPLLITMSNGGIPPTHQHIQVAVVSADSQLWFLAMPWAS